MTWVVYACRFEMARIPGNLSVEHTVYRSERNWGFGPGGNETGLTLYRLAGKDAERLVKLAPGLTTDARIRAAMGRWRQGGDYGRWHPTPIDPSTADEFARDDKLLPGNHVKIDDFLERYGHSIVVDAKIANDVDRIINAPGAYYAPGPGSSLIVVAPREELVIFACAG